MAQQTIVQNDHFYAASRNMRVPALETPAYFMWAVHVQRNLRWAQVELQPTAQTDCMDAAQIEPVLHLERACARMPIVCACIPDGYRAPGRAPA